jgi:hypothetical protein
VLREVQQLLGTQTRRMPLLRRQSKLIHPSSCVLQHLGNWFAELWRSRTLRCVGHVNVIMQFIIQTS